MKFYFILLILIFNVSNKVYSQIGHIEKVTYSNIFELRASRRETTAYMDNCLKRKTKIYLTDVLTGKEELDTIFKYNYSFY